MQSLLTTWLALGALTAGVMTLGFKKMYGLLTLRHRLYVAVAVIAWPIQLVSALLVALNRPGASGALERIAFGWIDALCDWWHLRQIRKIGGDGGGLAYLKDLRAISPVGDRVRLEEYDDVVMDPNVFVSCGGTLPPDRPEGPVLIRVQKGVAQWHH